MHKKDRGIFVTAWESVAYLWRRSNGGVRNVRRASSSTTKRLGTDHAGESYIPTTSSLPPNKDDGPMNIPLNSALSDLPGAGEGGVKVDNQSYVKYMEFPNSDLNNGLQMEPGVESSANNPVSTSAEAGSNVAQQIDTIRRGFLKRAKLLRDYQFSKRQAWYIKNELGWAILSNGDSLKSLSQTFNAQQNEIGQQFLAESVKIQARLDALRQMEESVDEFEHQLFGEDDKIRKDLDHLASLVPGTKPSDDLSSTSDHDLPFNLARKENERPLLLKQLFNRRGDLAISKEHLQDHLSEYGEAKTLRLLRQEQELENDPSDETFEQRHNDELNEINSEIKKTEHDIQKLEEECRLMGYDTTDDQNYSSSESTGFPTATQSDDSERYSTSSVDYDVRQWVAGIDPRENVEIETPITDA